MAGRLLSNTTTHQLCRKDSLGFSPCQGHFEGLDDNRIKIQDLGVEVNGTQGPRCDDHALELAEDRLHCKAGIKAAQLQHLHSTLSVLYRQFDVQVPGQVGAPDDCPTGCISAQHTPMDRLHQRHYINFTPHV